MTNEQINAAIAEACGWVPKVHSWKIAESEKAIPKAINFISSFEAQEHLDRARRNTEDYERKLSVFPVWEPCLDYCNCLNAMHEAESSHRMGSDWHEYMCNLDALSNSDPIYATARQRAEAFLRTLGKWEEVQE